MAARFYLNCPLTVGPILLDGPEAHHLATVSRLRVGDALCLFNGDGQDYQAVVRVVRRREVEVEITSVAPAARELPFRLEVAAPLPKGDRAQFLVEKLTELGVTSFVPLQTQRSVVQPREAKLEKLERYVIEASKQCGRSVLLQMQPLTDWASYCRRADLPTLRILAHPVAVSPPRQQGPSLAGAAGSRQGHTTDRVLAVGPEGGFTDDEVAHALDHGWRGVDLGPRILRVETAALALAALCTWSAILPIARDDHTTICD